MKEKQGVKARAFAIIVGASLAAGSVLAAAPANASVYDCPSGNVCFWQGGNYDGSRWQGTGSVNTYTSTWNDTASSIANRKVGAATWYANSGYWGLSWTLSSGDSSQLGGGIYNDIFSSHIA